MKKTGIIFLLAILLVTLTGFYQVSPFPLILSPGEGDVLLGIVLIEGTTNIDKFEQSELFFQFPDDPGNNWYSISKSNTPVQEGILGEWDTTSLADGNYHLKLVVYKTDQGYEEDIIRNLRVRNYSAIETNTPAPTLTPVPNATATSTATLLPPTPTQIPDNPISVGLDDLQSMLLWGLVIGALAFVGLRILRSITD